MIMKSSLLVKGGERMRRAMEVFAGYQFDSDYFNRSELDDAIAWACDTAATDISRKQEVDLKYTPVDVTPGNVLLRELKSLISASSICIFEASDLNSNVFIELGLALAFEKPIVVLVNSSALRKIRLPSDISGIVYCEYPDMGRLKAKLGKILYEIALKELVSDKANPYQEVLRHLWMGYSQTDIVIIGGEMLHVQSPSNVDGIYYVQSGDVKALLEASVNVAILNRDVQVSITSSSYIKGDQLTGNIISIGGPRSNLVTRTILEKLDLPWRFEFEYPRGAQKRKFIASSRTAQRLEAEVVDSCVKSDYCMIAAGPNPFNPNTRFALYAGLYTFGVLAGVRSVSHRTLTREVLHNLNTIIERDWSGHELLQIVTKATVVNGKVVTPIFSTDDVQVVKL